MARMTPETLEGFRESMETISEWRKQVAAALVWDVAPYTAPVPWHEIAEEACAHYENGAGIADGDPMFERYSDNFIRPSYILNARSDIRRILAEENRFLHITTRGVRKVRSDLEIVEAMELEARGITGHAENYNLIAEEARRHRGASVPSFNVQLLSGGSDE